MSTKFYKVKKGLNVKPNTIAGNESGDLRTDSSDSNKLKYHNGSSEKAVQTSANTLSANKAVATDSNGDVQSSTVTATELGYVSGVTSALQTQIDGKQATGNYVTSITGDVTASGPGAAAATIAAGAVTNSKVSSSAAIAYSKLNLSGSVVNADIGTSAAIARSKLDFGSGLVNADIATAAAIARSKVATGTANDVLINDGSGNLSSSTRLPAGNFPALTGDITTVAGALATTLATVNANVGTFGSSSLVPLITVNAKGLITAASTASVTAVSAWNIVSKTTTYTAVANDYIKASSTSFTITLPTAVGVSGQAIAIQHTGTSLTQVYTLNTTSSQTIGGISSGSYALYTNGEVLVVISDGSNWQIQDHKTNTGWISAGVNTITGTTTNPSKGTAAVDNISWRRNGPDVQVLIQFRTTSNGAAGSGDYLFLLPVTADTTVVNVYSSNPGSGSSQWLANNNLGSGNIAATSDGSDAFGSPVLYDSTHIRIGTVLAQASASGRGYVGSGLFALNGAVMYNLSFSYPASGWQP